MITIKNRVTGKITDIPESKWESLKGRNRNWEKIPTPKAKAVKPAKAKEAKEEDQD